MQVGAPTSSLQASGKRYGSGKGLDMNQTDSKGDLNHVGTVDSELAFSLAPPADHNFFLLATGRSTDASNR
jgi:hypothetical protein